MHEIDLDVIADVVSKRMARRVVFTSIEKIGSGYHSDGFRLTTDDGRFFFLKYIKSHDLGFEFPERQIASLLASNGMGRRAGNIPASVGVIVLNGTDAAILPDVTEETRVFHLQEFGGTGTSYSSLLEKNLEKKAVDDEDRSQIASIADALVKIHSVRHPSKDDRQCVAVYNDGLRSVIGNPELTLTVLSDFPADNEVLDLEGQKEMIGLMFENMKAWMGRSDRLTALHGDFWGANIFFREDKTLFIIDFSRIPWGDPAIDVGWFMAQYLWFYHLTGNRYFRDLTETWLQAYQERSGDKELRKALPLVLGWTGIVQIFPRWFPDINVEVGKKFMAHTREILLHKEFLWND